MHQLLMTIDRQLHVLSRLKGPLWVWTGQGYRHPKE